MELVGEHVRIAETGASAQIDQAIALRDLIVLDHAARRMRLVRQFDRRIGKRTAALARSKKVQDLGGK